MVRTTLNNSRNSKVILEDEINTLDNYLSLERMRFENKFDFKIHMDKNIQIGDLEIPPMLIQPYIENAITHGLSKESEKGLIEIFFEKESNYLKVSVKDNGIGIEQSKAMKCEIESLHKSVGMSITKKRLEMIDDMKREENVKIKELRNEQEVLGTQVEIWIKVRE